MSHGHGVDNCSLGFCRKGRQLNLEESRSPTQFSSKICSPLLIDFGRICKHSVKADGDCDDCDDGDGDGCGDSLSTG
jgi:hypothetical protein